MSTRKTDRPSVRRLTWSSGVVRAKQQHQVGMQRARRPDLLAADDVAVVAAALGARLEPGGVGAGGRLRHAERLQAQFAARDCRQVPVLLCGAAVAQQRSHDVHLRMRGAGIAAVGVDLFEDDCRRPQRQPGAIVFLRDQRREKACFGEGAHELGRIGRRLIERAPILARKGRANPPHRIAQLGIVRPKLHGHRMRGSDRSFHHMSPSWFGRRCADDALSYHPARRDGSCNACPVEAKALTGTQRDRHSFTFVRRLSGIADRDRSVPR